MQIIRMFSAEKYKGTRNYLKTQKKYEVLRTLLYFGISLSLFFAGYFATKSYNAANGHGDLDPRLNLLTIVAVLGCLPASKSAVSAILYLRTKSLSDAAASAIMACSRGMAELYDMVFTSYSRNFSVGHMTVRGNTVCGYSEDAKFDENAFYKHIDNILKTDGHKDVTVKIFTDLKKYTGRLEQMRDLEADEGRTAAIVNTLKSVAL